MSQSIPFCEVHNKEKRIVGIKKKYYRCYDCTNAYRIKYNQENREKVSEKNRKYNASTKLRRQQWTENDRKNNPERYKNYGKKYYALDEALFNAKRLAKKHGLSLEQYQNMILLCNNRCEICNKIETRKSGKSEKLTRLCIDHDHTTKKVRGLLCFECNILLGKAKDNTNILHSAIQYLQAHQHKEAE